MSFDFNLHLIATDVGSRLEIGPATFGELLTACDSFLNKASESEMLRTYLGHIVEAGIYGLKGRHYFMAK